MSSSSRLTTSNRIAFSERWRSRLSRRNVKSFTAASNSRSDPGSGNDFAHMDDAHLLLFVEPSMSVFPSPPG